MQFKAVNHMSDGRIRKDLIFYLKDGRSVRYYGIKDHQVIEFENDFQSSLSIRESIHIQTEDGTPLKLGSYYLITKVKITGHPTGPFIWGLIHREHYSPKFRDLLSKIVPGMTEKTIFITKFVVKEI